jgi:hypothetical protein
MYYLLGYRILGQCEQRMKSLMKLIEESPDKRNYRRHFDQNEDLHVYYKDILGPRLLLEVNFTNELIQNLIFDVYRRKILSFYPLMVTLISVLILFEC